VSGKDPEKGPVVHFERFAVFVCLAVTAMVYLMYAFGSDLLMTAEQASEILAGREMLRQKTVFLRDWSYATELYTLRSPLAVAFFGIFTGESLLWAHRLSVALELALEILALSYMTRRLGLCGRPGLLLAALFFGLRSYQSGLFCGMGFSQDAAFYSTLFLTLGYCAAASQGIRGRPERILRWALPAAAFLFGLSSIILFVILYLPLLLHRIWRASDHKDAPKPREGDILGQIALWNALCLAGYLILCLAVVAPGRGPVLLTSGESVGLYYAAVENLPLLLTQFADGTPLRFIEGAGAFVSLGWLAGFSFLAVAILALWKTPRALGSVEGPPGEALRVLAVALVTAFLLMTVHLESHLVTVRHLGFLYVFAAILLAVDYRRLLSVSPGLARLLFSVIAFAVIANGANNMATLPRQASEGASSTIARNASALLDALYRNGARRAYALYWDSYVLDVLGSGRVSTAAVDGWMRPFLKNASLRNYGQETARDGTAFIRTRNPRPWAGEALNLQDPALLDGAGGYVEIADPVDPIRVYFFEGNPFTFQAASGRGPSPAAEKDGVGEGKTTGDESGGLGTGDGGRPSPQSAAQPGGETGTESAGFPEVGDASPAGEKGMVDIGGGTVRKLTGGNPPVETGTPGTPGTASPVSGANPPAPAVDAEISAEPLSGADIDGVQAAEAGPSDDDADAPRQGQGD
jgi:hypothetical protein